MQESVVGVGELERRLHRLGLPIGDRLAELYSWRGGILSQSVNIPQQQSSSSDFLNPTSPSSKANQAATTTTTAVYQSSVVPCCAALMTSNCIGSNIKKENIKLLPWLYCISHGCWSVLFGKPADSLESSKTESDECKNQIKFICNALIIPFVYVLVDMIVDNDPLLLRFIAMPKDLLGYLSVAAFVAGILQGILSASDYVR